MTEPRSAKQQLAAVTSLWEKAPGVRKVGKTPRLQDTSQRLCFPSTSPSSWCPATGSSLQSSVPVAGTPALSQGVNYARALAAIKTLLAVLCPSCNNSCWSRVAAALGAGGKTKGFRQQGLPGELFQGREFRGGGNPISISLPVPKHAVTLVSCCPCRSGSGCQGNSWRGGSGVPGSAGLPGGGLAGTWPPGVFWGSKRL